MASCALRAAAVQAEISPITPARVRQYGLRPGDHIQGTAGSRRGRPGQQNAGQQNKASQEKGRQDKARQNAARQAEKRLFPAIDPGPSGTRREDLLMDPAEHAALVSLRRALAALDSQHALELLLDKTAAPNEQFLRQVGAAR